MASKYEFWHLTEDRPDEGNLEVGIYCSKLSNLFVEVTLSDDKHELFSELRVVASANHVGTEKDLSIDIEPGHALWDFFASDEQCIKTIKSVAQAREEIRRGDVL